MGLDKRLDVVELDFDEIKQSLITYLNSKPEFTDYNFEGSAFSVLLDILAYNTHYMGYYLSMLANEMFIDTAMQRASLGVISKHLGYLPTSVRGASATVNISATADTGYEGQRITLPAYSVFDTVLNEADYEFVTIEDYSVYAGDDGSVNFSNVVIKEGRWIDEEFPVDANDYERKYVLSTYDADISTIKIEVQESPYSTNTVTFERHSDINLVTGTSNVFFLSESTEGKYEVSFGDGTVGRAVSDGNIVRISYLKTNGEEANGAKEFGLTSIPNCDGTPTVALANGNSYSSGGGKAQSKESIRFLAPLNYEAQNRVVTTRDYKARILAQYSDIESIRVWGGEEQNPPEYGKVYISIKPYSGNYFATTKKNEIKTWLKNYYTITSIEPEIVDPDFTYIRPNVRVTYDPSKTANTENQVRNSVINAILNYSDNELSLFDADFSLSRLSTDIDEAEKAILNNHTTIKMEKEFYHASDYSKGTTLQFNNQLQVDEYSSRGPLSSSSFFSERYEKTLYFDDDAKGNVRLYYLNGAQRIYVNNEAGTIDYITGEVSISSFLPAQPTTVRLMVTPYRTILSPQKNQIFQIREGGVSISMVKKVS